MWNKNKLMTSSTGFPDNFNFPEFFSGSRKIRAACRRVFRCNFRRSFRICSPFWSSMHWNASYALGENRFLPVLSGKSGSARKNFYGVRPFRPCPVYVPSFIPIPQANQKLEGGTDTRPDERIRVRSWLRQGKHPKNIHRQVTCFLGVVWNLPASEK